MSVLADTGNSPTARFLLTDAAFTPFSLRPTARSLIL